MELFELRVESAGLGLGRSADDMAMGIAAVIARLYELPAVVEISAGKGVKVPHEVTRKRLFHKTPRRENVYINEDNLSLVLRYSHPRPIEYAAIDLALLQRETGLDFSGCYKYGMMNLTRFNQNWLIDFQRDEPAPISAALDLEQKISVMIELWCMAAGEAEREALLEICDEFYEPGMTDRNEYRTKTGPGGFISGDIPRTRLIRHWQGPINEKEIIEFKRRSWQVNQQFNMVEKQLKKRGQAVQPDKPPRGKYIADPGEGQVYFRPFNAASVPSGIYLKVNVRLYQPQWSKTSPAIIMTYYE